MNELFLSNTNIKQLTDNVNELNSALSKIGKFTNLKLDFDFSSIDGIKNIHPIIGWDVNRSCKRFSRIVIKYNYDIF